MSDYENYQEASGWLDPMAIPLGMYGKRLQFIVFDSDGNRETVLTGILRGIESDSYLHTAFDQGGFHRWYYTHSASLWVPALTPNGDPSQAVSIPLGGKILWKEIP